MGLPSRRWMLRSALVVARALRLWPIAGRQVLRLAPAGWWRRWPFLPLPDPAYLHFRLQTMYGGQADEADPHDVVTYLRWCRRFPHS